ncbi:MAG: OsmC family protein [Candidatus Acidiferrales bacterium]|jgi:putative redox protein
METAKVTWAGAEEFDAVMPSGNLIHFDGDGKSNKGPSMTETLLGALGACTAVDVVSIIRKKRQKLVGLEILVSGEKAPEPPRVWTKIEMVYRITGEVEEKAARDAVELSKGKYCSVSAMLEKTAEISYRIEIVKG